MSDTVLVTGAAGYIGCILIPELLDRGFKVIGLDTYTRGDTVLAHIIANPNFEPVRGDARDESLLKDLVAKSDIAIPLAALVGAPLCNRIRSPPKPSTTGDRVAPMLAWVSPEQRILPSDNELGIRNRQRGAIFAPKRRPPARCQLYGRDKVEAERPVLDGTRPPSASAWPPCSASSPRMRLDLLVNDFTYRAVNDRAVVILSRGIQAQLHPRPRRGEDVPARDR